MRHAIALASIFLLLCAALPLNAQSLNDPGAISVEKFAQLPVMTDAELSPDGTHLAYIRPIKGRKHLIVQSLGGQGKPAVVPPTEDLDFDWLHWANNDRLVFSVSATRWRRNAETRETRLWAINRDGTNPQHIVRPSRATRTGSSIARELAPPQIQSDVIHWLPDEADHILVAIDGDHDGAYEVRRIDIRDGEYDVVMDGRDGIQDWLTDQAGNLRIGWGYRNESSYRVVTKRDDGQWRSVDKSTWLDVGFFPQAFTASQDIVYMRGPDKNGFAVVRKLNISTGEFLESVFAIDGIDANGLALDPVTLQPAGVRYIEHQRIVQYFDDSLAALQRSIDAVSPDTANEIVSMSSDRRKVLIHSSSDVDAGTYTFLDRDKNALSLVAEAMPGLPPDMMSPIEPVSYAARDGLTIPAYLTVPRGKAPENLPVVVLPHGGPSSRDDQSFWFLSQFLASRGYAIFQPNFRGSSGYGRSFEMAGRREWGGKMQEDVTDGTHWLIEQGIADPDRVCIVGWSYGGYSAAMGAIQNPDLYQCAASINGVLNLPRLIADDLKYIGGSVWTRHMGFEDENSKSVSPYHQAERIQIPMLIIQAKDDPRVHLDQGKRMADRLKRLKKQVQYVAVDLGGHNMSNEGARQTILRSLESFLAQSLQPE